MIKKLRIKFILVNMAFAVSILSVILGLMFFARVRGYERETEGAMMQALNRRHVDKITDQVEFGRRPTDTLPPLWTPTFVLTLGPDETTVSDIEENNLAVTEQTALKLIPLVEANNSDSGTLEDYSLRYLKLQTADSTKIAFGDRRYELDGLRTFGINCLIVFFIASLLFFLLSFFLSKWALKPVKEAWEQQNRFIADASHELKTPLTVILANLQILSSHSDVTIGSQVKWLNNTKDEAARMRRLVEELLFLARHDAGTLIPEAVNPDPFNFSDTVLTCVLLFESVAFENKVTLEQDIDPDITIKGNETQLKQVITILLDNACKYAGKRGNAKVTLKRTAHHAVLTVHNSGEPIPTEEQAHIFERFYRADKSRVRKEGGYGLGLAIARTILEEQHGKISVSSSKEKGTDFTVSIAI